MCIHTTQQSSTANTEFHRQHRVPDLSLSLSSPLPPPHATHYTSLRALVQANGIFDLGRLQAGCPAGVDPMNKELSLGDADFQAHFGMAKVGEANF